MFSFGHLVKTKDTTNDQKFYYGSFRGRLLGSKAREQLILNEIASLSEKDFFADIGCAQGHYLEKAFEKTNNVFGLDFDFNNLGQVLPPLGFGLVHASAEAIPFREGSFDFVLCSEVLEHVPDWKKALKELKRISRKKIVITIPLEKAWFWRKFSRFAPMHTRGHLHVLWSKDIESGMKGWKLEKKVLIHTPVRHVNKLLEKRVSEKKAMYSFMVFSRNAK
ncbi:MAG: class I SAM-dependent methyltransferase [Candidatus ainarchaeum sp.]|nr:class I SAM-dependent methyltransferase [Candidatus ainarchaeum sp.]